MITSKSGFIRALKSSTEPRKSIKTEREQYLKKKNENITEIYEFQT